MFKLVRSPNSPLKIRQKELIVHLNTDWYKILILKSITSTKLTDSDVSRVIEMAWEDRTPFDAIALQFSVAEGEVIALMRRELKAASFRLWRKRVTGRTTKHAALRSSEVNRHRAVHTRP